MLVLERVLLLWPVSLKIVILLVYQLAVVVHLRILLRKIPGLSLADSMISRIFHE